jgi:hypothetical protein
VGPHQSLQAPLGISLDSQSSGKTGKKKKEEKKRGASEGCPETK